MVYGAGGSLSTYGAFMSILTMWNFFSTNILLQKLLILLFVSVILNLPYPSDFVVFIVASHDKVGLTTTIPAFFTLP